MVLRAAAISSLALRASDCIHIKKANERMKKLIFLIMLISSVHGSFSQQKTIQGKVSGEAGPLEGVSIQVRGSSAGYQSDKNGSFSVPVTGTSNQLLVFSAIGYKTYSISAKPGATLSVSLEKTENTLEDVVVVGYNSVKRKDLTGSVSSVSAKQIKDVPLSNAAEALQGRLAGVQVQSSEGAPGAELVIRVRGGGSITQDNSPLYIVDGIQVENALSVIAPQDIATVDVLKDASTTAIYGARAANGVIMITTKSGRAGKTQVSYNGSYGYREVPKFMNILSPYDFVRWQYERSRGSIADSSSFAQTYGTTWDTLNVYKNLKAINWQEEVFGRKANFQNHNVSVNGGNQNTSFNLSITANREDGVQLESGFDRNLINFKLDHKVSDRVKTGFSVRYLDQIIKGIGTTNSGTRATNRLRHTINYRPFEIPTPNGGIDDFDEAYFLASSGAINPVILTRAEYRKQFTAATYMNAYVNINLAKNLTFRSTAGYDNGTTGTNLFYSKITSTARNSASLPVASIGRQTNSTLSNTNTLQYNLTNYKKHHDITVLAGQETVDQRSSQNTTETRFFPADISADKALANMGLGSAPTGSAQPLPFSFVQPPSRIFSLFGRASYAYDDKYLLNVNVRADRSSKFSAQNGTLVFPSTSLAWRISKEKFFDNIKWISDAKLRFGYGAVGNNRIDNLLYLQLYGVTGQYALNHSILPGLAPTSLSNPALRWEQNVTRNIGLDLSLFGNKLQLTIDAYKNSANDLLLAVQIPPTTGYTTQIQNIGATSNKGLEIQLNSNLVQTKNFTWNSNLNLSFNKNTVESLGGVSQITRNSGWQGSDGVDDYIVKVGESTGQMYGFVTDGFYGVSDFDYNPTTQSYTIKPGVAVNGVYGTPQPGMLKWKDLNKDGVITADGDRAIIGNANPKFIGGWNNQFSYKNFDLSVFVNFVVGNDIYNANKLEWTDGAFGNLNMLDIMKNRYTNINDKGEIVRDPVLLTALNQNATIWSPVRVQRWWLHSWAIEDGSYLRINNLTLGYSLPKSVLNRAKISGLRFFATVNNLATITGYSGYDPDVTARRSDPLTPGVDFAAYPRSRTWVFGANLSF
jgi:TonB-linked SusC/RagA family outer membrane protein